MTPQQVTVRHVHIHRRPRLRRLFGWAWRRVTGFIPFYGWFRNALLCVLLLWSYATFWAGDAPYFPGASCGPTERDATGIVGASYAAGAAVRDLNNDPPTPAEVQAGLEELAAKAGEMVGTFSAAMKGRPSPTEPVDVPVSAAVPVAGCGSCPSGVAPVRGAGSGINLAARAALRYWSGENAVTAVAIAGGESSYNPDARNPSGASGMWQTMMPMHAHLYHGESWRDPYANARVAHQLWQDRGWQPWVVYTEGTYLAHMDEARAAVQRAGGDGNVVTAATLTGTDGCDGRVTPTVWSAGDADLVDWDGHTVDRHTATMLRAAGRALGGRIRVTQGSYCGGCVAASGGTHDGGGVVDTGMVGSWEATEAALREAGLIAWHRTPEQGPWPDHIHAVDPVNPFLSPEAQGQVASFEAGGDGLGSTPDPVVVAGW